MSRSKAEVADIMFRVLRLDIFAEEVLRETGIEEDFGSVEIMPIARRMLIEGKYDGLLDDEMDKVELRDLTDKNIDALRKEGVTLDEMKKYDLVANFGDGPVYYPKNIIVTRRDLKPGGMSIELQKNTKAREPNPRLGKLITSALTTPGPKD